MRKYLNDKEVPQLFVGAGATLWGDYLHYPWSIGFQPSYQAETAVYAKYVLTNKPDAKIALFYEPRFSPDGGKVAYVVRRPSRDRSRVLEYDLATGAERVLVDWPALNYDPVYSPDGSEIAFASTVGGRGYEVYRLRLADGKSWQVTFDGCDARYPDYRPAP